LELGSVQLCVVHLCDCTLGVVDFLVHDVCGAAVNIEGRVHGHAQVFDGAILAKDFADVVFLDVSGQGLDDNLHKLLAAVRRGWIPLAAAATGALSRLMAHGLPLHFSAPATLPLV
jgi:hypothetical protein